MKALTFWNIIIKLQFNEPHEETGFLSENFNLSKKQAYATAGISELLNQDSKIKVQWIIWQIFQEYFETARIQKLDYLQKLTINWEEVWLIDNWEVITLLTKEEY